MKKIIGVLALGVTTALFGGNANAQIPVTDVAHITLSTSNQAANIAKYIDMIAQNKTRIEQMKNQYEALTGSRGMAGKFMDPQFVNHLPDGWQGIYDSVKDGGYSGLTGTAQAIRDANKLFDSCMASAGIDKQICERRAGKAAQDKAFSAEAFNSAQARWDQIAGLIQTIDQTTDPKAIAELQARINGEQAAIQNEQTKLMMFKMMAEAEDRLIQQQEREASAKWGSRSGGLNLPPRQ